MGYGGNLIWTSVVKALHASDGKPVVVCRLPQLSDLCCGRLHDGATSLENDPIFRGNPRLIVPPARAKSRVSRLVDLIFGQLLRLDVFRRIYEELVFRLSERRFRRGDLRMLHVDMRIHSYAARQDRRRTVWKRQPRAADAVMARFHAGAASMDCELFFTEQEHEASLRLVCDEGLGDAFIVVEPDTNRDYFGELRAWPFERWKELVERLHAARPDARIAQLGIASSPGLPGVVDLRGRTDFRTAAMMLARAQLFIGTEGGLMHAANAVGARALILWGGVTLPEFAGYPERQRTICKYVACAPCGQRGWCDNGHICMRGIGVDEVLAEALELLDAASRAVARRGAGSGESEGLVGERAVPTPVPIQEGTSTGGDSIAKSCVAN